MSRAPLLLSLLAVTAFAQAKVPQRPAGNDCISGSFKANGVLVCNLRDAMSSVPMVRVGKQNDRLDFTTGPDDTPGMGWVGLEALPGQSLWVGVLDWMVESPGSELVLVTSSDAGKSWLRLPAVKKPHDSALFRSLKLKSAREWTLEIALDDCADCGVAKGVRVYDTHDAGLHWTQRPVGR